MTATLSLFLALFIYLSPALASRFIVRKYLANYTARAYPASPGKRRFVYFTYLFLIAIAVFVGTIYSLAHLGITA